MPKQGTVGEKRVKRISIPYSRQWIGTDDISIIAQTLKGAWITQGPKCAEFEKALAGYCGAGYAAAFSSGTAALHAAYFAAGMNKNSEVITSPITFLSTANAALFLGARPVFADIEPDSGNIDTAVIENFISRKTRCIVPVHYGGHPADLEKIAAVSKKHNLTVIEDACHALGAEYKSGKIGNCRYSDMTVFSFHPVKSITTGEGGAVLTNNKSFYKRLIKFRTHGVTKERPKFSSKRAYTQGDWYYEMQYLGYNYRLTDIQCALGISQMKKLDRFIKRRRQIAGIYDSAFRENRFFCLPGERDYGRSSWHLYSLRLKDKYKRKKRKIFEEMKKAGLGVQVHYIPVYLQPYYRGLGYKKGSCPNAEDFYAREISIPLYPSMGNSDVKYVIKVVMKVFSRLV